MENRRIFREPVGAGGGGLPLSHPGAPAYTTEQMAKGVAKKPSPEDPSRKARLRAHVRARAEDRPGVYRMLGADGDVLYVGKSVRVRSRLLSYFRASPGEKAAELVRASSRIRWEYVSNEFWALVRELRLIKRWRPVYNVEHKRRRSYAFVKITRERAPRLVAVGRVTGDGATYFGPFPRPGRLGETVRELSHLLGLRDCPPSTPIHFGDQLEIFGDSRPPRCLRLEAGTCLAPCAGRSTADEYRSRVELARRFLEGRSKKPLARLQEEMGEAARRMDFEYAALLRDRMERLQSFQERLVAFRGRVRSLSFVYRVPGHRGADRLYLIRRGVVREQLTHPKSEGERRKAARRVETVYREPEEGAVALRPEEAAEILLVSRWFDRRPREMKRTFTPEAWLEMKRPAG